MGKLVPMLKEKKTFIKKINTVNEKAIQTVKLVVRIFLKFSSVVSCRVILDSFSIPRRGVLVSYIAGECFLPPYLLAEKYWFPPHLLADNYWFFSISSCREILFSSVSSRQGILVSSVFSFDKECRFPP